MSKFFLHVRHRVPVHARLGKEVRAAGVLFAWVEQGTPPGARNVAFVDVALAAAVEGGVHGEAEGIVAGLDAATDDVVHPGAVADEVELEDLAAAWRLGHRLEVRQGGGAQDHRGAEFRRPPRPRKPRRQPRTAARNRWAGAPPGCAWAHRGVPVRCGSPRRRSAPWAEMPTTKGSGDCASPQLRSRHRRADNPRGCRSGCAAACLAISPNVMNSSSKVPLPSRDCGAHHTRGSVVRVWRFLSEAGLRREGTLPSLRRR